MNKKRVILLVLFTLILAVLIFLAVQYYKLYDAPWDFAGTQIKEKSFSKVSFAVFFKIKNSGFASASVTGQDYDVFVNDKFLSKIINYNNVFIAANSNTYLPLLIEMKLQDLIRVGFSNFDAILNDKSKVIIKIKGTLTLKTLWFITIKDRDFEEIMTLEEIMGKTTT